MRLRKIKNAAEILEANPDKVILNGVKAKGKWKEIFKNDNEIHIEVGTGKGRFIYELAKINPHINYIGIEMMDSVVVRALEKLIETNLENVRLLRFDAQDLKDVFEENEVTRVYLNFSDPWPKNRHARRRLTYKTFIDSYRYISKTGELHFKTDNRELFEFSVQSFNNNKCFIEYLTFDLHSTDKENIQTEYEERFSKRGFKIYKIEINLKENYNG